MGARERTLEHWRDAVAALDPDDVVRQRRAVGSAINADGTIKPEAVATILPWQRVDWYLPGPARVGTNVGGAYRIVQPATLKRIDAWCQESPSGTPFTAIVKVVSTPLENVSVPIGNKAGESVVDIPLASGTLLRLDVVAPGGSDVTVTAWYQVVTEDET